MRSVVKLSVACIAVALVASASVSAQTLQKNSEDDQATGTMTIQKQKPGDVKAPAPQLGGTVRKSAVCEGGKSCATVDQNHKQHEVPSSGERVGPFESPATTEKRMRVSELLVATLILASVAAGVTHAQRERRTPGTGGAPAPKVTVLAHANAPPKSQTNTAPRPTTVAPLTAAKCSTVDQNGVVRSKCIDR